MRRFLPLMLAWACASEPGPAVALSSGECTSTTRQDRVDSYVDIVTAFDVEGRQLYQREEYVLLDGTWLATKLQENGYFDGLLVSEEVVWDVADANMVAAVDERTLFAYDEEGRLVEEQREAAGKPWTTTTHRYDDEGLLVESYIADRTGQVDDWQELRTWDQGRLQRREVWNVDQNGLSQFEDHTFLESAPSLDARVHAFLLGMEVETLRTYDGERVVEVVDLTRVSVWGYDTYQWAYREDGQVAMERSIGPEVRDLAVFSYDREGRQVRRAFGEDADGDDVIDEVSSEQTWAWSCD